MDAETAWQRFSDSVDAAEGVADERDCFMAGWAAAHGGPPEYRPDDAEAQHTAETYADAAAEMHWIDAAEEGRWPA